MKFDAGAVSGAAFFRSRLGSFFMWGALEYQAILPYLVSFAALC